MNASTILTHLVALAAGWILVSLTSSDKGTRGDERASRSAKSTMAVPSTGGTASPRALLSTLARTAMDPHQRTSLMKDLYNDWADHDPKGLLEHLHDRAWPSYYFRRPFYQLAKTDPEYLYNYARREGCQQALEVLCEDGDPRVVLKLILAQDPPRSSAKAITLLFEKGTGIDPDFARNVSRLPDLENRTTAFKTVASNLLQKHDYDSYLSILAENAEAIAPEAIADDLGDHLIEENGDLDLIGSLPATIQKAIVAYTISELNRLPSGPEGQRQLLNAWMENGWLDEHVETLDYVVQIGNPNTESPSDPAAWRDWGLQLPREEQWEGLRLTAVRRWILDAPEQWEAVSELPTQGLRDAAYTALVYRIDLAEAEARLDWVTEQIEDSELREVALSVIASRREGHSEDPFSGPDSLDPFDPLEQETESDPFSEIDPFGED